MLVCVGSGVGDFVLVRLPPTPSAVFFGGLRNPAGGLTVTSLFIILLVCTKSVHHFISLYMICTLADVLLDCKCSRTMRTQAPWVSRLRHFLLCQNW